MGIHMEQTLKYKQMPHPPVDIMGRASTAAGLCTGCTQDRGRGPSGKPRLACPILLARLLLLGSLAQDNVQGSKVSLPGDTAAPCPGCMPATPAASPCQPCAPGSWGVAEPHAWPAAAGGAWCPTAAHLVYAGCALQDALHKHNPDFSTVVLQDKVHPGKCKPSPAAVSPGDGAACPAVSSQLLTGLAVLRLCHGALPGPHVIPEPGRLTPSRDGHRQLGAGARRHRYSLLERLRVRRGLGGHRATHPSPNMGDWVLVGTSGGSPGVLLPALQARLRG